ncbi:hypothetical protein KIW84_023889 [Lathyrus oleraceus]|uniref:Uncharacterized protein n=2 Tax=Pisum sativum TaxID=3888 RepID=A0A9D5BBP8_PEA|nr:hypothetical protein KIW84_023889 [Pisum sativum]
MEVCSSVNDKHGSCISSLELTFTFCPSSVLSFDNSCAPSELKSAMKGSRDKNGEGHVKLTVKWAADVYDPIPTLVSHTVKNKKQPKSKKKKNEKKSLKKGNKGNSTRGSNGKDKDKKQSRNLGEHSELCYELSDSQVIEGSSDFASVDVCSQDSNCGASFLKKSVTEMHYSVAEAQ